MTQDEVLLFLGKMVPPGIEIKVSHPKYHLSHLDSKVLFDLNLYDTLSIAAKTKYLTSIKAALKINDMNKLQILQSNKKAAPKKEVVETPKKSSQPKTTATGVTKSDPFKLLSSMFKNTTSKGDGLVSKHVESPITKIQFRHVCVPVGTKKPGALTPELLTELDQLFMGYGEMEKQGGHDAIEVQIYSDLSIVFYVISLDGKLCFIPENVYMRGSVYLVNAPGIRPLLPVAHPTSNHLPEDEVWYLLLCINASFDTPSMYVQFLDGELSEVKDADELTEEDRKKINHQYFYTDREQQSLVQLERIAGDVTYLHEFTGSRDIYVLGPQNLSSHFFWVGLCQ